MDKTSPYREWAKKNQQFLNELLAKNYISKEDLRKISNFKNQYSLQEQESAFKNFKERAQKTFSDERANPLLEDKEYGQRDFIKSAVEFRKTLDAFDKKDPLLSSRLIEEINSSNYKNSPLLKGLAEQVKGLSDKDLREFLWVSRTSLDNRMTKPMLDALPSLEKYIREQPTFGVDKKDYDKMFGTENALDKAFDGTLNYNDIEYRARQNGMTGKQLLNQMAKDKTAKDRKEIAHGGKISDIFDGEKYHGLRDNPIATNIGGTALSLFGRRQQEAIERGEDPTLKDYAGDIGEQALYAVPMGKVIQAASVPAKAAWGVGSAAVVPHISELYDAIVYPEDNPRGEYSEPDALLGTGTNLVAPYGLRMLGRGGRKIGLDNFAKPLAEMGEGETAKEASDRIKSSFGSLKSISPEERVKLPGKEWEAAKNASDLFRTNTRKWGQINNPPPNAKATLFDIASVKGPNGEKEGLYSKYKEWLKQNNLPEDTPIDEVLGWGNKDKSFVSEEALKMYNDLGLYATEGLQTKSDIVKSDALKNYLTNQFGNFTYGDENIRLPFLSYGSMFGVDLNKNLQEMKEKKKRDEAIEKAKKKYQSKIQDIYNFE
ncbi:MAG: hypothetical protein IIY21_15505 [Clostridiales bacterium]|nr:hypothetical protein [Clostridiales bacterium]MBQ1570386.1 hypothetical protein [Clostridiales bacterium]